MLDISITELQLFEITLKHCNYAVCMLTQLALSLLLHALHHLTPGMNTLTSRRLPARAASDSLMPMTHLPETPETRAGFQRELQKNLR